MVKTAAFTVSLFQAMAKRLSASEALSHVLEHGDSSDEGSDFSVDSLPSVHSDEEPFSPPLSPVRARASSSSTGSAPMLQNVAGISLVPRLSLSTHKFSTRDL